VAEWRTIGDEADFSTSGDERLWESAAALVEQGITSPQEVIRVLGLRRA
jgi:hypothetical protein